MSWMLRAVRNNRWNKEKLSYGWLDNVTAPAEPLADIADSSLSLYAVHDDFSNVRRIIAALAATRHNLSNFDYVLFPMDILKDNLFAFSDSTGMTSDSIVNSWHYDVKSSALDASRLLQLMWQHMILKTELEKSVLNMIVESVKNNYLECSQIRIKSSEKKLWEALDSYCP
ncbi:MAG: hypothetical protein RLP44_32080 [Aggregatilineales bacterium]